MSAKHFLQKNNEVYRQNGLQLTVNNRYNMETYEKCSQINSAI